MTRSVKNVGDSGRDQSSASRLTELLADLNLNISSNPLGTDKGDFKSYVRGFYEDEFSRRRSAKNRLLEIGVRTGASLALWANYFEDAEIIGADVEALGSKAGPVREYVDLSSVTFICADAYSQEFALSLSGKFSIMIDDGPHSLASQKRFMELYLPKLEDDGVMIIEDIQRGYRDAYQLMKSLPAGNKYVFEIHDFRSLSRTGDDFLFVIRHNRFRKSVSLLRNYVLIRALISLMAVPFRRIKRALVSVWH